MKRPAPLRVLWQHHKPTLLLTVFALAVALFFALRFVVHAVHWQQVRGTHPPIEPWMTPRYIATAWHVPQDQLMAILGQADLPRRPSLTEIAQAQGRPVEDLIADLSLFLTTHKGGGQ